MSAKTATRAALEAAHEGASHACGRLALILSSGRGLTEASIKETAGALNDASVALLKLIKPS